MNDENGNWIGTGEPGEPVDPACLDENGNWIGRPKEEPNSNPNIQDENGGFIGTFESFLAAELAKAEQEAGDTVTP